MKPSEQLKQYLKTRFKDKKISAEQLKGGKNSEVVLVTQGQKRFVLKHYFPGAWGQRNRMNTEFETIRSLWSLGVKNIPQALERSDRYQVAMYEYIEGTKKLTITKTQVRQALSFIKSINEISQKKKIEKFSERASDACFSLKEIEESIQRRFVRFEKSLSQYRSKTHYRQADDFLKKHWLKDYKKSIAFAKKMEKKAWGNGKKLLKKDWILSPSDFGFHNALLTKNRQTYFFDFEYFGWDDPVKMIADFCLHPAMKLPTSSRKLFIKEAARLFKFTAKDKIRLQVLGPIYCLKWCLILLNEFLSEHRIRRMHSQGLSNAEDVKVLREQLQKAKKMIKKLNDFEKSNLD